MNAGGRIVESIVFWLDGTEPESVVGVWDGDWSSPGWVMGRLDLVLGHCGHASVHTLSPSVVNVPSR